MQLMTKELEKIIPAMYSDEDTKLENKTVYTKFFIHNWMWWILEYSKEDRLFFAYVQGQSDELGYVSLDELENLEVNGLRVERDLHFAPTRYGDIKELKC
ncbi:DUF2958 domain-containing protein [Sulfurimonas aquatica]|uniref:DUF2958 domain-containing protein n=1 Tax=Sulfurimonas aquatica TaxID=2672570 RepID=A0A975AZ31_9BACT|nr:DUF2958 domain-containing protein [Sulfurimonas aquatica]QSZ41217.1 DUF2958 domain-containing protein [Sulfurimonas aquatica]